MRLNSDSQREGRIFLTLLFDTFTPSRLLTLALAVGQNIFDTFTHQFDTALPYTLLGIKVTKVATYSFEIPQLGLKPVGVKKWTQLMDTL